MTQKSIILILLLTFFIGLMGCATKKAPYTPSSPSLAEQLDALYRNDHKQWRNKIEQFLSLNKTNLPSRHLIYAVQEFNDVDTKEQCLAAAFLYMHNKAKAKGRLYGDDRKLFSAFVEYVLKHHDTYSMDRVKELCLLVDDEICHELR